MKDLISVATKFRDAFTYDPGHSDLDNEQPIHVTVTLGDWRALDFILGQIARAEQSHGPTRGYTVKTHDGEEPAILVAAGWVKAHARRDMNDWACAQCVPHSDCLVPGFVCYYHQAEALLARDATPNGRE